MYSVNASHRVEGKAAVDNYSCPLRRAGVVTAPDGFGPAEVSPEVRTEAEQS